MSYTAIEMSEEAKVAPSSTEEGAVVAQSVEANPNHDVNIQRLITDGKNPRGIPTAKFIVSCILPTIVRVGASYR